MQILLRLVKMMLLGYWNNFICATLALLAQPLMANTKSWRSLYYSIRDISTLTVVIIHSIPRFTIATATMMILRVSTLGIWLRLVSIRFLNLPLLLKIACILRPMVTVINSRPLTRRPTRFVRIAPTSILLPSSEPSFVSLVEIFFTTPLIIPIIATVFYGNSNIFV